MLKDYFQSRREFLRVIPGLTLTAMCWTSCSDDSDSVGPSNEPRPARAGIANPYVTQDGRPILVCVEGGDFDAMLREGLARLGGLATLVNANQSVLIKPNCNYTDSYPGISRADCVAALVAAARSVSSGLIKVGDQGYYDSSVVYPHMELQAAVSGAGGTLVTFKADQSYPVRLQSWGSGVPNAPVYSPVYDSPIIINCCCLKRHHRATMSCCLKNNVGTVNGPLMGDFRAYLHSQQEEEFQILVAEIAALIKPELNIVDARQVLTINGPITTQGEVVTANKLILCGDMVAADAYCARLMASLDDTFSVDMIQPTLGRAAQLGLGTADLNQVEIVEVTV